jgi:hypothetical protein
VSEARRGAIDGEDAVAHLDGEAPELARQIAADPPSAALLGEYAAIQGGLRRALLRFDCPSPHELGEYTLRLVGATESAAIDAHLRVCPRCVDEFRDLRAFLDAEDPAPAPGVGARLRRLVATLLPSSPPAGLSAGAFALRGEADPTTRTYAAEGLRITVDLAPEVGGLVTLDGLLAPDDDALTSAGAAVTLHAADGASRAASVDEWGNFTFEGIAPGEYRLEIALGDGVVTIDNLPIGG